MNKSPFPDYPGVGSLCIKCTFCSYTDEYDTCVGGHMEGEKFICDEILIPGSYFCNNLESPKHKGCVVGHLGCKFASQIRHFGDEEKEIFLDTAKKISFSGR